MVRLKILPHCCYVPFLLTGRQDAQQAHRDKIEEIKENWLNPLQHIIEKINIQFSDYFKQIKCAGEVHLKTPDNPVSILTIHCKIHITYTEKVSS